jgi:hypothetical protein
VETYKNPLDTDPQWLCHLNLVFAIGLQLRKDINAPTPTETSILQRLEGGGIKRADIFYTAAKHLKDPVAGIEDGGIAVVQSLLLMTIYMLASSKRNTSWGYLGKSDLHVFRLPGHFHTSSAKFHEKQLSLNCRC